MSKLDHCHHHLISRLHILTSIAGDIPVQPRMRSPMQMTPNSGLFPYPNMNPFALPGMAPASVNYSTGLAGLAASQQLQNMFFPGNLYAGGQQMQKPLGNSGFNIPCYDQVPANMYPFFGGLPSPNNWMPSAAQFGNALPPNHPFLQVELNYSRGPIHRQF